MSEKIDPSNQYEVEKSSTLYDIRECQKRMLDLERRLENPTLSEEQMKDVRTAIHELFEKLRDIKT
ncbi:MAG: hypothetical protein A3A13_01520 [Candidatus Yanofskybacteria bacterium RIFCSPLOWO2_01_FULL_43_22]|uniref:Uncharacterized protein n=1 Tax=Candidatus Yanofskybacteria bacterium RIFCSPLOWO2_01_FULL_43_22 TaxID=1802695 RepID=A0A1F8GI08_9BACT|nr:MAG: hypothetical protein A3A13_01520 [Candidatus Yanofskybacteria bacterium RIFCSPLOWO2_01_FULL_43_22]